MGGRTTQFARTIATLQGVLSGLYPGTPATTRILTARYSNLQWASHAESCCSIAWDHTRVDAAIRSGQTLLSSVVCCTAGFYNVSVSNSCVRDQGPLPRLQRHLWLQADRLVCSDEQELLYSNLATCERLDKVFKQQMAALKGDPWPHTVQVQLAY